MTEQTPTPATVEDDQLPPYAPIADGLPARIRRRAARMLADLPLRRGDRVLDMACGAGVYTSWLAERAGPGGRVYGVDISAAYLALARKQPRSASNAPISFQRGNIDALPFSDHTFDLVWCAQSMQSLPRPHQRAARAAPRDAPRRHDRDLRE